MGGERNRNVIRLLKNVPSPCHSEWQRRIPAFRNQFKYSDSSSPPAPQNDRLHRFSNNLSGIEHPGVIGSISTRRNSVIKKSQAIGLTLLLAIPLAAQALTLQ